MDSERDSQSPHTIIVLGSICSEAIFEGIYSFLIVPDWSVCLTVLACWIRMCRTKRRRYKHATVNHGTTHSIFRCYILLTVGIRELTKKYLFNFVLNIFFSKSTLVFIHVNLWIHFVFTQFRYRLRHRWDIMKRNLCNPCIQRFRNLLQTNQLCTVQKAMTNYLT